MSPVQISLSSLLIITPVAVRLAARFFSQTTVRWAYCFGFAVLFTGATLALGTIGSAMATELPMPLSMALSLAVILLVGAWFFSTRAVDAQGSKGGWLTGLNITAGTLLFLVFVAAPLYRMVAAIPGRL